MTQSRSWKENDGGSGESMTSTSWRTGDADEDQEELKQRTKKVRKGGEVESQGDCDRSNGLEVRWERFFPRMVLRVLLVEADDCTRQIIAALLRKCSYQVTAVPDGLKAWEILTGRPHDIDLILTEVELPSVSGYALLTLVMDHDICKNIPVIMMSTQDSVHTVYKCMLRGAADYLVKPIRRNELRNLWQHVWRRHSTMARRACPEDKYIVLDEIDPACDNDAASKPSIGNEAFPQRNKKYVEKGSNSQDGRGKSLSSEAEVDECRVLEPSLLVIQNQASDKHLSAASKESSAMTLDNTVEDADLDPKVCESNNACFTGEEIDFMGAAPLHRSTSLHTNVESDSCAHLDLSLRSSRPSGVEIQAAEGTSTLKHSSASSFTRYTGRHLYFQHSTSSSVSNPKEPTADSERNFSSVTDSGGPSPGVPGDISVPVVQVKVPETENSSHPKYAVQIPAPVARTRINDKATSYTSMFPPFRASDSTFNETMENQDKMLESLEDQGCPSPVVDQKIASNSLCDAGLSHRNSMGGYGSTCGSNSDVDQVVVNKAEAESNDKGAFTNVKGSSTRSMEREAALAKFRLKRKERCYDKKVRYESRKTLAEQRPRVKGQFVCQVPAVASTFRT